MIRFYIVKLKKHFKVNIPHFFKHLVLIGHNVCIEKSISSVKESLRKLKKI